MMKLMYIPAALDAIPAAEAAGVDRIFIDLEFINKVQRQLGRDAFFSSHTLADVKAAKTMMKQAELLVRVNPLHAGSAAEINAVCTSGADVVMLPMVMDAADAREFVGLVDGRAQVCLLLETAPALVRLDDLLDVPGVDEIYIGLNDLHLSMKLTFMFELLSGGIVEYMAEKIKARGIPFGFGGMAKIGEGMLPAECILAEHIRLGSDRVILSRVFRNETGTAQANPVDLKVEVKKIRDAERQISEWPDAGFQANQEQVQACVTRIVKRMNADE